MSDSNPRPSSRGARQGAAGQPERRDRERTKPATSPTGTVRVGRRETARRRREMSTLERLRTPLLALAVIVVVVGVLAFAFMSAAAPTYACGSIDTVQPAASGEIGQVQQDMGNTHVQPGDQITYAVCPPASGRHVNKSGFGPLQPKVYGPDDNSVPNGWVHNLEHGGLVILYSCTKGACDDATIQQLRNVSSGFPNSPVCNLAPGVVGPVVARFEQMPTRFAALLWDRVLYLDTLDTQQIYDFFTRYSERVTDTGTIFPPPEPQCAAPSASAGASESPSAVPSSSVAPSASAAPSVSAPASAAPSPSAS